MKVQGVSHVVGVFEDQNRAVEAAKALAAAGFPTQEMALITRDWRGGELPVPRVDLQNSAAEGALAGSLVGGTLGVAAGTLLALIPGIGIGALVLGAMGGAAGAAGGAYAGPFVAMEMNETEAQEHARHLEQGRTVLVVRTADRQEEASSILDAHGAYDFSMSST